MIEDLPSAGASLFLRIKRGFPKHGRGHKLFLQQCFLLVSVQLRGEQKRWVRLGGAVGKTLGRILLRQNSNVE
jgi:hypothetical protein